MGCHSDSGYEHQARGFYAQMIVGASFNSTGFTRSGGDSAFARAPGWNLELSDPDVSFSASTDATALFYGAASEKLALTGTGSGGVTNRGLSNAGMVFQGGKEYDGYIFARLPAESNGISVELHLSLENFVTNTTLATQVLSISGGSDFRRYNFSLTPSASTTCVGIAPGSDPSILCGAGASHKGVTGQGHACVRCAGQFKISLLSPGAVLINYVYLQPGQWGRIPGLPVLKSAADTLKEMGIKAIRQGGSYASSASARGSKTYYQWQKWTGPAWTRPSRTDGVWQDCLLSGWGPFEMIDMCMALGIEPVITTTDTSSAEDFAGLVEYCYGNATTPMGAKRHADGHPQLYHVKYFELGNEQYNSNYIEQVEAMEKKARELGIGKTLHYMFPSNGFLNDGDVVKAAALKPRIDSQLLADLHVGAGGAVGTAEALFASQSIRKAGLKCGAVNAETNAATHAFARAMSEAADLNDWFNAKIVSANATERRLHFRAASFCMGSSSGFDNWDQPISMFLPNTTWLQPPGIVHSMIDKSWQPNALQIEVPHGEWGGRLRGAEGSLCSAQQSDDGKTLVLRYVNFHQASPNPFAPATNLTIHLTGSMAQASFASATMWSLSSKDPQAANTPSQPLLVTPVQNSLGEFGNGTVLSIPGNSYVIVVATLA